MAGFARDPYQQPLLDDEEDELYPDTPTPDSGFELRPLHTPAIEVHDVTSESSSLHRSRVGDSAYLRRTWFKSCRGPTGCALVIAFLLLGLCAGYLAGIYTTVGPLYAEKPPVKATRLWRTHFEDYGTESCVRLVDADGDGLDDVIIGLALGKDISFMLTAEVMDQFCKDHGMEVPCAGSVVALRGYDGKLIWQARTYAEIFELNCHSLDVDGDGVLDCIATGRLGTIAAIGVRSGKVLWASDGNRFNRGWNIYGSALLHDFDYDGVPELVISHGGDPTIPANNHTRNAGWLMMLSGATGQPIGRALEMPESKETYCVPVIHTRRDGSQYILYGSGGETVSGLFLAVSVPAFYRYVHQYRWDHPVPNMRGPRVYTPWGNRTPSGDGVIEIYRSKLKGIMVPPVLVDVTRDGVKDILMSAFDGTLAIFDGETLEILWTVEFHGRESYSTPAPGFFNDDDTLDFMLHFSQGAWPFYNSTDTIVLDGRDGTVLWNLTTAKYDVSSDLVARSTAAHRDVFLFRTQGRDGVDPHRTGAIHGATGIQRVVTRRYARELFDARLQEAGSKHDGFSVGKGNSKRLRSSDGEYIECESDQMVYTAELFAVDRTTLRKPLKIWDFGSNKYFYKLTDQDRKLVQKVVEKYGENVTTSEDEVPWSRGRRGDNSSADGPFCVLVQPDDRTTGALGDVDGDGNIDVIVNVVSVGVLRDEHARFVKMKFNVDIFKLTLDGAVKQEMYTPVNVTLDESMDQAVALEEGITTLTFKESEHQTWGGYMGTFGDSIFKEVG